MTIPADQFKVGLKFYNLNGGRRGKSPPQWEVIRIDGDTVWIQNMRTLTIERWGISYFTHSDNNYVPGTPGERSDTIEQKRLRVMLFGTGSVARGYLKTDIGPVAYMTSAADDVDLNQ